MSLVPLVPRRGDGAEVRQHGIAREIAEHGVDRRILHAVGLTRTGGRTQARTIGIVLTYAVIALMALTCIAYGILRLQLYMRV